jgi:ABC-type uncharacterized transport system substrate-binding protein
MQQLMGKGVDAVFVPLDNTVLFCDGCGVENCFQHAILLSSDSDSVTQGVLVSSGYTHFDTGMLLEK